MRTCRQAQHKSVKQLTYVRRRHRPAKQVSLSLVNTIVAEEQFELFLSLDALDHNVKPQLRTQARHAAQQGDPALVIDKSPRNDWSILTLLNGKLCK